MLNTTSRAFSNLSSSPYMTPTRSRARTAAATNTGHDCGADYFASSADFEYDLFLNGLGPCDSAASFSSVTSGPTSFFSRYRSNRPFSSTTNASSGHSRQMTSSAKSYQQPLFNALSITSLNRSSFYGHDERGHTDISSQQQQMKNLLASNLSLGNMVPFNASCTAVTSATNLKQTISEETNKGNIARPKATRTSALVDNLESENVDNLSHQQMHALHRFRRQKEKGLFDCHFSMLTC